MASSARGPRRRRPSPRPLDQCPESAEWPRLELVVARPLAEIPAPSGERSNQRERRLRLLAAQLMLKSLLDDLGDGHAALIRNPAGTLQQLGVHFDGSCRRCSHAWILPPRFPVTPAGRRACVPNRAWGGC